MGAKIASFLATMLLSIPLAAIGLMAIFGVPEIVPASPGAERSSVLRNVKNALNWGTANEHDDQNQVPAYEDAPRFGPVSASGWPSNSSMNNPGQAEFPAMGSSSGEINAPLVRNSRGADSAQQASNGFASQGIQQTPTSWGDQRLQSGHEMAMSGNSPQAPPSYRAPSGRRSADGQSTPRWVNDTSASPVQHPIQNAPTSTLSWKDASLRLTELGIKKFHLERGASDGMFLFVCLYAPVDAPQVTHRFESEADDPLLAVNQVLHQVDQWMQSRFAQANYPSTPPGMTLTSGTTR